jgi:hypothetical protein
MRPVLIAISTVYLLSAFQLYGQQSEPSSPKAVEARLAYRNTFYEPRGVAHAMCFAAYEDGSYRLSKMTDLGRTALAGALSQAQRAELDRALEKLDFRSLGGGLVLEGLEAFRAEVRRKGQLREYDWVNPDHARPLPKPAAEIVDWLEHFQALDAVPFEWRELSDLSVCPPATVKDIQPAIARLSADEPAASKARGQK